MLLTLVLFTGLADLTSARGQGDAAGGEENLAPADTAAANVDEVLGRIDELLERLDARIEEAWARADEILNLADSSSDPDEQMRLEELYGRTADLALSYEDQRAQLGALRTEIGEAANGMSR